MSNKLRLLLIALSLILNGTGKASVRTDHRFYDFWMRAHLQGWTEIQPTTLRPVSAQTANQILTEVKYVQDLTEHDQILLDELRWELSLQAFDKENIAPKWQKFLNNGEYFSWYSRSLWSYDEQDADLRMSFNPVIGGEIIYDESFARSNIYRTTTGIEVRAQPTSNWTAGVRFIDNAEFSADGKQRRPYRRGVEYRTGIPENGGISYDRTIAYIDYNRTNFHVKIGRDNLQWGSPSRNNLILNSFAPTMPMVQFTATLHAKLQFSFAHCWLDPAPLAEETIYVSDGGKERKVNSQKYLAAHRLVWMPVNSFSLGLTETVVYGERGIQLGYALPLNVYWSENHNQNRDDNILWGLDFQWRILKRLRIYGEYLLDEGTASKLLKNHFHNRTALNAGFDWLASKRWSSLFSLQYTLIRPYVYTHWFPVNIYSHAGHSIGVPLPPNSDEWYAKWTVRPRPYWTFGLEVQSTRHGASTGGNQVGGSILDVPQKGQTSAPMFAGVMKRREEYRVSIEHELLELVFARISISTIVDVDQSHPVMEVGILWNN